ncbi:hypothetical protein [Candidatus Phycosocius spiralis]|uniref:hypothetical protein n=1 Tax=Candidatus Phycosocius spiralis TaxID=2815099 RepID=UPI0024E18FB2|nr:hypothetical protein [Candidatus Phycosocius spiralis]
MKSDPRKTWLQRPNPLPRSTPPPAKAKRSNLSYPPKPSTTPLMIDENQAKTPHVALILARNVGG